MMAIHPYTEHLLAQALGNLDMARDMINQVNAALGGPGAIFRGIVLNSHTSPVTTATDGPTVTFHCDLTDWHQVTLGGSRTLALLGDSDGQQVTLVLRQDGTGGRLVTWPAGIAWHGGAAPTLTATPGGRDVFTLKRLAPGVYLGFTVDLDMR